MSSFQVETSSAALFITLDRPPRNVLDLATIRELHARLSPLQEIAPSGDAEEGVRASFEKRAPRWSHS